MNSETDCKKSPIISILYSVESLGIPAGNSCGFFVGYSLDLCEFRNYEFNIQRGIPLASMGLRCKKRRIRLRKQKFYGNPLYGFYLFFSVFKCYRPRN